MARSSSDFRPLKQTHYLILLALSAGDLHGYGLKKEIARRTDGDVRLGAGSLYRSISQLLEAQFLEPSDWRPSAGMDDERRAYFRLTPAGRAAATNETERLAVLVAGARAAGFVR
jgi:DNA-binding PadR family transcriptional regulator